MDYHRRWNPHQTVQIIVVCAILVFRRAIFEESRG